MTPEQRAELEARRLAKKATRHASRSHQIAESAMKLLRDDATIFTMKRVGENIGISKPLVYYYFENEREIIKTIAERMTAELTSAIVSVNNPNDLLLGVVKFYTDDKLRFKVLHVLVPYFGLESEIERSICGKVHRDMLGSIFRSNPLHAVVFDLAIGIVRNTLLPLDAIAKCGEFHKLLTMGGA